MTKRVVRFLIAALLFLVIAAGAILFALRYTPCPGGLSCRIAGVKIDVCKAGRVTRDYLCLPSSADFSALALETAEDVTLCGNVRGASLDLAEGGTVDVTSLFRGEMKSGKVYRLRVKANGKRGVLRIIKSANIASIHITSDTPLEELNASKDNKGQGSLVKIGADGTATELALTQIKGRGNSTWRHSHGKPSYNIKLDKRSELIEGAGAAKGWCLISSNMLYADTTGLLTEAAFDLYRDLGGTAPLTAEAVDLYINGAYRGHCLLTEKVGIDKERVDITETKYKTEGEKTVIVKAETDPTDPAILAGIRSYAYLEDSVIKPGTHPGGILLEMDEGGTDEAAWFKTRRGICVSIKDPDVPTREQVITAAIFFQEYEDAVFSPDGKNEKGKHFTEYADLPSIAKEILVSSFVGDKDAYYSSEFFAIDADGDGNLTGKMSAVTAWDFDLVRNVWSLCDTLFTVKPERIGSKLLAALLSHEEFRQVFSEEFENICLLLDGISKDTLRRSITYDASLSMSDLLFHRAYSFRKTVLTSAIHRRARKWQSDGYLDREIDKFLAEVQKFSQKA